MLSMFVGPLAVPRKFKSNSRLGIRVQGLGFEDWDIGLGYGSLGMMLCAWVHEILVCNKKYTYNGTRGQTATNKAANTL